jgi:hypothetical protein
MSVATVPSPDELATLSPDELTELTWQFLKPYYKERPVDFETFVTDPYFLGSYFSGLSKFYPFWMKILKRVFPNPFHTPYSELIWSLPIGSGKSLSAATALLYEIYKLSCLHDPNKFYGIAPGTPIVVALFSATLNLATDVNWSYLEKLIVSSEYFQKHCPLPGGGKNKTELSVRFPNGTMIALGSSATHFLGMAVISGLLDEANFQRKQSLQAQQGYLAIKERRNSRFMGAGGSVPGVLILASSPMDVDDFLDAQMEASKTVSHVLVLRNTPIWEIRKGSVRDDYGGQTFRVYLGDTYRDPYILKEDGTDTVADESKILEVPVEHKPAFTMNLVAAIRDVAGYSTSAVTAFITQTSRVHQAAVIPPRFTKDVIELDFGSPTLLGDTVMDYLADDHFKRPSFGECLRFLHLDIGLSRDRLGLAGVFALQDREPLRPQSSDDGTFGLNRTYMVDFVLYVKAKQGQQVPLYKVREFILWLKKRGYPIAGVSADQFQAEDMLQQLKVAGFKTEKVSVDKTRMPYMLVRDLLYSGRLLIPRNALLKQELCGLQDDGVKVDHTPTGSKDGSDALAGALWSCARSETVLTRAGQVARIARGSAPLEGLLEQAQRKATAEELSRRFFIGALK